MSIVGPRPTVPVQVEQYTERQRGRLAVRPGITGWAQVNGRTSLPWAERIELDLWYVEHRSLRLDLRILARTRDGPRRPGPVQGRHGGLAAVTPGATGRHGPPHRRRASATTSSRAFAQHATVVAADPNPLAPAQYAAHVRRAVPRIDDPATSRRWRRCATSTASAPSSRSPTSTSRCSRRRAPTGACPRSCPTPRSRPRPTTSTRRTCCSSASACPRRPPCCPASQPPSFPVMVKPRRGSGARSIHPAADAERGRLLRRYVRRAGDGPAPDGRAASSPSTACRDPDGRCLNAIPRTMIESRGGESIKGTVLDDPRAGRARARGWSRRSACAGRAPCRCSATARSGWASPTSTRASAARSPRRCTPRCPGRTYPELIVRMAARRARSSPTSASSAPGCTFTRYYWQLELDEAHAPHRPRHRARRPAGAPLSGRARNIQARNGFSSCQAMAS